MRVCAVVRLRRPLRVRELQPNLAVTLRLVHEVTERDPAIQGRDPWRATSAPPVLSAARLLPALAGPPDPAAVPMSRRTEVHGV